MRSFRQLRSIAAIAALAIVCSANLPAAHLHADTHDVDGPVVHRHVIDADSQHGLVRDHHADGADHDNHAEGVDHADHASARFLSTSYIATSKFKAHPAPAPAVHLAALTHLAHPTPSLQSTYPPLPTHDPPLSFISSPAPPA